MARPNDSAAIAGRVQGLRELKAAFQALPEITRDAMLGAVRLTAAETARAAKGRVLSSPSVQTRSLFNAIAFSVNEKNGRAKVGVTAGSTTGLFAAGTGVAGELKKRRIKGFIVGSGAKARLVKPSRYAHFIEFGTRKMAAEPFMMPAVESQKQPFLDRCRAAGRKIEQQTAAVGVSGQAPRVQGPGRLL